MAKPKKTTTKTSTETKVNPYEKITNSIVEAPEAGTRPWHKPWNAGSTKLPMRHNGEQYHGINVIMLWVAAETKGYNSPYWMTFNQAQEYKASVRKGEKGTMFVKAGTFVPEAEKDNEDPKAISYLKTYWVFNADQIDGLPEYFYGKAPELNHNERITHAEEFFANTGSKVVIGGNSAAYSPSTDTLRMPVIETFDDAESYYATLAHEHVHWTGAKHRLDRNLTGRFGDESYAMEELMAEIGSAFVCSNLSLPAQIEANHAPYIKDWIRVLKNDKRAIFKAATLAQAAVEYLTSLQPQEMEKAA